MYIFSNNLQCQRMLTAIISNIWYNNSFLAPLGQLYVTKYYFLMILAIIIIINNFFSNNSLLILVENVDNQFQHLFHILTIFNLQPKEKFSFYLILIHSKHSTF